MRTSLSLTLAAGAALAAAGAVHAQDNEAAPVTDNKPTMPIGIAALGDSIGCPVVVQDFTDETQNLGIERAFGRYFVTNRSGATAAGQQTLYQFDLDWNLEATYAQLTLSDTWGNRDGEALEGENRLFFGAEAGELTEYVWDPMAGEIDLGASEIIQTDAFETVRALAWDPNQELFFSKDFSDPIEVFDRDGNFVNLFLLDVTAYGAAWDPVNQTIWFNVYIDTGPGTDIPNTRMVEFDPVAGEATGREFETTSNFPDDTVGFIPGGMDIFADGDDVTAVVLHQANPSPPGDFVSFWAIEGDGSPCSPGCRPDLDGDGELTIFDFLAFQNAFDDMDPVADFDDDGEFTIFDFLAFQNAFDAGCP